MGKIFKEKSDIQYKRSFQKNKVSLGMGGFAEVKLVYHKDDPETLYAMKKVKKRHQQKIENIHKEISLHSQFAHENIIKFIDQLETQNSYLFFLEYAENGDLYNYIKNNKLSLNEIVDYFKQICNAVEYLHSRNIMHRDLKLENILLTKEKKIKLCDFGWSVVFDNDQNRETLCGTYEYMAYEIFLGQPQTVKTDIWALGVILYELFHRRPPFRAKNLPGIIQMIQNPKQNLILDPNIPSEAKILIKKILQLNPGKRPSIKAILRSDFFKIDTNTCQQEQNHNTKNFNKKNNIQTLQIPTQNKKDFTSSQDTLFDKHSTVGTLNEKKISFKKILNQKIEQEQDQSRKSPTQKLFQQLYKCLKQDNNSKKNSQKRKTIKSKNSNNSKKKLKKKKTCKFEEQIETRTKSKTYTQRLFQTNLFDQNIEKNYSQSKRFTHKDRSQVIMRDRIKPTKHSVKVQKFSLVNRRQPFSNTSCDKNQNMLRFNIPDLGIKKLLATPQSSNKRDESQEVKRKISFTDGKKFVNSIYMQIQKQKSNVGKTIQKFKNEISSKNKTKQRTINKKKIQINLSQQNSNQSLGSLNGDLKKINKQSQESFQDKGISYKRYQSFQQGLQLSYREKITTRKIKANINDGFLNIYSRNKKAQLQLNFI